VKSAHSRVSRENRMIEDMLLIWKFKSGDKAALAQIYEKYKCDLLRVAAALLTRTTLAEDIVHDVFISFAQAADRLRVSGNLKGYLVTSVVNRARNINQAQAKQPAAQHEPKEYLGEDSQRPEQWLITTEEFTQVKNTMAVLPYEQREVITLHLYGEMTFEAIAKSQSLSINTVQSRYRYGLDKLRSLLNGEVKK
jgi:RNA polymerase sigma factor (sigma-70 family)